MILLQTISYTLFFLPLFYRVPSMSIFSGCGGRMPSTQHISASPMVSGSRRCAGSRSYVHHSLRYGPRELTLFFLPLLDRVPSMSIFSCCGVCMPSPHHSAATPMVSGSRRCAGSRAYVHHSLRYGPRGATPCLPSFVASRQKMLPPA